MSAANYKEENEQLPAIPSARETLSYSVKQQEKILSMKRNIQFKERKGAASLIMRSNGKTDDKKEMYVANINGESGAVRLFKFEGNDAPDLFKEQKSQPDR